MSELTSGHNDDDRMFKGWSAVDRRRAKAWGAALQPLKLPKTPFRQADATSVGWLSKRLLVNFAYATMRQLFEFPHFICYLLEFTMQDAHQMEALEGTSCARRSNGVTAGYDAGPCLFRTSPGAIEITLALHGIDPPISWNSGMCSRIASPIYSTSALRFDTKVSMRKSRSLLTFAACQK